MMGSAGRESPKMPVDEQEKQGDDYLECALCSTLPNGHNVELLYKHEQLDKTIFPEMERALDERGFQKVDFRDLLTTVAAGGTISLTGPRFQNQSGYSSGPRKMGFMWLERNLVNALMVIVFSKEGNISYGRSPISFEESIGIFNFDYETAYRKTTMYYYAERLYETQPLDDDEAFGWRLDGGRRTTKPLGGGRRTDHFFDEIDVFRVTIEGTGHNLSMHQFKFEPSITWLCNRYPEMKMASIGRALTSEGPPQHAPVAVVGGEPVAEACNDGGGNPSQ